ncbi:hypothetical protein ANO11243_066950 [Dothideomycetidae sp. 11243]|nr:hypothetical protein ANO11243_066950 [fungal sp. No.11243]
MGGIGGVSLSAPQFANGLYTLAVGASVSVSTYFLAATTDTASLGFWASVYNDDDNSVGGLSITYTDTAHEVLTAPCNMTSIGRYTGTQASVTCAVAKTAIETGTVTLSFNGSHRDVAFGFYYGETASTYSDPGTTNTTVSVPGQTVYLATDVSTTYDETITTTHTITLTGAMAMTDCSPTTTSADRGSTAHAACTSGSLYHTLAEQSVIARHLCNDLLKENHRSFPSSASVWPATTLSRACSCYERSIETPPPVKRGADEAYGGLTAYDVGTVTEYNSTSTETDYTSVTVSTSISYVDAGTSTADAATIVTIDDRSAATACATSVEKKRRGSAPTTCAALKLQAAYLYLEMREPINFCRYYLSKPRTHSPLIGVSATALQNTCKCAMENSQHRAPVPKANSKPAASHFCNQKYATVINAAFHQHEAFCKYWNADKERMLSPLPDLCAADIYSGCACAA